MSTSPYRVDWTRVDDDMYQVIINHEDETRICPLPDMNEAHFPRPLEVTFAEYLTICDNRVFDVLYDIAYGLLGDEGKVEVYNELTPTWHARRLDQ